MLMKIICAAQTTIIGLLMAFTDKPRTDRSKYTEHVYGLLGVYLYMHTFRFMILLRSERKIG